MITTPRGKPRRASFLTYDLEWEERCRAHGSPRYASDYETPCGVCKSWDYRVTMCGAYDERGYRSYKSVARFLRGELVPGNAGRRFYAHFGGASDMVFLLKELIADERLSVKGVFSGSSAILVSVRRGDLEWQFVDSFWLMRTKLANIGEFMGLPKLKIDFARCSEAELRTYNERDCKLLFDAVARLQEVILEAGGELGVTAASTAMKTFLRKYLKRPIQNSDSEDEYARPAYTASRVEPIRRECAEARVWDINSSFPYSMTFPCPGSVTSHSLTAIESDRLWVAECDVESDGYIPTLPYRTEKGRIFFPTGRFRTRLTSEDFRAGGFTIHKVHSCRTYEDRDDLREFATDFYAKRKGSSGFESEVFKIILNSLYGKFAERNEKSALLVRPDWVDPRWHALEGLEGVYLVDEIVNVPHSHVPISCMITARSRRFLLEWINVALDLGGEVYYCDTDSVITDAEDMPCSTSLGGLKLEKTVSRGMFVGPKLYALETDERQIVKAKGFSAVVSEGGDRTPLSYSAFVDLTEGACATVERMLRPKELLRREGKDYVPRAERQEKRLGRKQGKDKPRVMPRMKRCHLDNGDSRPWDIGELVNE